MESGKQYKVFAPDGIPYGYFLDGRLYEYRTSTCVGFLNDKSELVDNEQVLGHVDGDHFVKRDGVVLDIGDGIRIS